MKKYIKVSLKQLKQELSSVAAEAASGTLVEVTRYNKPFLHLLSATQSDLHVGKNASKFTLKPLTGLKPQRTNNSIVADLLRDRE